MLWSGSAVRALGTSIRNVKRLGVFRVGFKVLCLHGVARFWRLNGQDIGSLVELMVGSGSERDTSSKHVTCYRYVAAGLLDGDERLSRVKVGNKQSLRPTISFHRFTNKRP